MSNHRRHLLRYAAGDDHQIRLPRRTTEDFGAETCDIEPRCGHRHHFDGTACKSETHWPDGVLARPIDHRIELGKYNAFRFGELRVDDGLVVDARKKFGRPAG